MDDQKETTKHKRRKGSYTADEARAMVGKEITERHRFERDEKEQVGRVVGVLPMGNPRREDFEYVLLVQWRDQDGRKTDVDVLSKRDVKETTKKTLSNHLADLKRSAKKRAAASQASQRKASSKISR